MHKKSAILIQILSFFVLGLVSAQPDTSYSFICAGHAYGDHSGGNIGLYPSFLNSLDTGFDPNTAFFVFTGDIVNQSTPESWQQVKNEMDKYSLPYYYVMGNHDYNETGVEVFNAKFGGTYYSFIFRNELFIVLNSIESDRSVSPGQIDFMEQQITQAGDSIKNVFVFFHEILWNSSEKYMDVMSNSRSRYDQMIKYSNYWEEIHPLLTKLPEKEFYLIAGDVGGNTDAIAAFYDKWDNITFIASGMGEVADENYLSIFVHKNDSISFELVALDKEISLSLLEFYSIPPAPESIIGPEYVYAGSTAIEYFVPGVFNTNHYNWEMSEGITGFSVTNQILLDFASSYNEGTISVRAEKPGFGKSPATSLHVNVANTVSAEFDGRQTLPDLNLFQANDEIIIRISMETEPVSTLLVRDVYGKIHKSIKLDQCGTKEIVCSLLDFPKGIYFITLRTSKDQISRKFIYR